MIVICMITKNLEKSAIDLKSTLRVAIGRLEFKLLKDNCREKL